VSLELFLDLFLRCSWVSSFVLAGYAVGSQVGEVNREYRAASAILAAGRGNLGRRLPASEVLSPLASWPRIHPGLHRLPWPRRAAAVVKRGIRATCSGAA